MRKKSILLLFVFMIICQLCGFSQSHVNIYVENSGSMDGYIMSPKVSNGKFLTTLGMLTSDLQKKYDNNVDVFFILDAARGKTNPKFNINVSNSLMRDLQVEYNRLRASRSVDTKLDEIVGRIVKQTNSDTISVFFTDCIYSDPITGAENMMYSIFNNYVSDLLIYRYISDYSGKYFHEKDRSLYGHRPKEIYAERSFFVWVFGSNKQLNKINNLNSLKSDDNSAAIYFTRDTYLVNWIPLPGGNASFIPSKKAGKLVGIESVKQKNKELPLEIRLGLDLNELPLSESYVTNPENYESNYIVSKITRNTGKGKYTHLIDLKSKGGAPNCRLSLKKSINSWSSYSTKNDYPIIDNLYTTYDLFPLMTGIANAYSFDEGDYFTININVSKDSEAFPIGTVIVVIFFIGIIFVVFKYMQSKKNN